MPNSIFQSGPVDLARVDPTEANEFHYWTHRFACTPHQLIDALRSAGVDAPAVGRYFAVARVNQRLLARAVSGLARDTDGRLDGEPQGYPAR